MIAAVLLTDHLIFLGGNYPGQREQEKIVPLPKALP